MAAKKSQRRASAGRRRAAKPNAPHAAQLADVLADTRQARIQGLLAQQPADSEARRRIGLELLQLKSYRHAQLYLEEALADLPERLDILSGLGQACLYTNDPERALGHIERALPQAPERFDLLYLKGMALLGCQRIDEALALFEYCVEIAPDSPKALTVLSRHVPLRSEQWDYLVSVAADASVATEERVDALFALGKRDLNQGRLEDAFNHFDTANRLFLPLAPANGLPWRKLLGYVAGTYPEGLFERFAETASDQVPELFIVGPSRSGKSLVESILAQHPSVIKGGERFEFMDYVRESASAHETLNGFIEALSPGDMPELSQGYLNRAGHKGKMVTNTHPDSIFVLGILGLMFPKTPIVFCMRNLLDMGMAAYFTKYDTGNQQSYDLHTLGEYIASYEKAMQHWANVLPNPILMVEYSELVKDPEQVARNLYHSLGLDEYRHDDRLREQATRLLDQLGPADSVEVPTRLHSRFDGLGELLIEQLAPLIAGYRGVAESASMEERAKQQRLIQLYEALIERQKEANVHGIVGVVNRLLELDPGQPELKALLGTYVSQSGRHQQGLELLLQAGEMSPQDRNIQIQQVEALLRAQAWQQADSILRTWPENDAVTCQLQLQAFVDRHHAELQRHRRIEPTVNELEVARGWLSRLKAASQPSPIVTSLEASLEGLARNEQSIELHEMALSMLAAAGESDGRHQTQEAKCRLQYASTLLLLERVEAAIEMLHAISRIHPYSLDTQQAYQRFTTWLGDSSEAVHREWAGLHGLLERQWQSYSQDDLQFSFGDFGLPYQGYARVALPGSRPTEARIEAYKLRDHLAALKEKKGSVSALDIGCNHGFLLLELADQLDHGTGFDISPTCIEVGNTVARHLKIDNISLSAQTFESFMAEQPERHDLLIACAVHRWIGLPMPEFGRHLHSLLSKDGLLLLESQGIRRTTMTEQDFDDKVKQICAKGFEQLDRGALCDDGVNYREFYILRKR
ncbi:sulfotransferase [Halomonas pacifica]|uniref:Sulfotransferase n=1 Tax=Bisbaumannia pacifica TaxID=77098 RepID=A0A510XAX1_9GAMM|nr:sulfotransferase [Halomonas pacifica]MBH8579871.1 sulfotransferase [Halomonas pacifica]MDC8803473.1 sulfotransferase [Halomonas pacifica]GEK48171.1 hypothetical protein HPA02_24540 [Halomonas pacifica]